MVGYQTSSDMQWISWGAAASSLLYKDDLQKENKRDKNKWVSCRGWQMWHIRCDQINIKNPWIKSSGISFNKWSCSSWLGDWELRKQLYWGWDIQKPISSKSLVWRLSHTHLTVTVLPIVPEGTSEMEGGRQRGDDKKKKKELWFQNRDKERAKPEAWKYRCTREHWQQDDWHLVSYCLCVLECLFSGKFGDAVFDIRN